MLIKNFDIRGANHGNAMAASLSGGNQQKAILAREITRKNKVIIIAQPTRGLDIGAINNVHKAILKERAKKKAILLISYELPEIFALADRILVISSGKISKELDPSKTSFKEIGLLMAGDKNPIIKKEKKTSIKRRVVLRKKLIKKLKPKKKNKSPSNTKITKIRYIIQKSPNHTG
jgi:simple sugar transport system ATP-binding protein